MRNYLRQEWFNDNSPLLEIYEKQLLDSLRLNEDLSYS